MLGMCSFRVFRVVLCFFRTRKHLKQKRMCMLLSNQRKFQKLVCIFFSIQGKVYVLWGLNAPEENVRVCLTTIIQM